MNSDKLCKLALLVMFILAVMQIYNFFSNSSSMMEHMNPALLTHQQVDWAPEWTDHPTITYYLKNEDRYSAKTKLNPKLIDPLVTDPGLPCGPKFDWSVKMQPGANNVYGDMIWSKASPQMILENNCLNCNHVAKQGPFNEPSGIASSLTTKFDNGMVIGSLSDQM